MRKLFLALTLLIAFVGGMGVPVTATRSHALPATDDFTRADGSNCTGNWTCPVSSTWEITGNKVRSSNVAQDNLTYWNADSFGADQYAITKGILKVGQYYIGPGCFMDSSGNGYGFYAETNVVYKITTGTKSAVGSPVTATWVDGDDIRMNCNGTTLEVFQNGVSVGSVSDSTFTSGAAGMFGYPAAIIAGWEGGNNGGGGGGPAFGRGMLPNQGQGGRGGLLVRPR